MKTEQYTFTCDACLFKTNMPQGYGVPEGWAELETNINYGEKHGGSERSTTHLCLECWSEPNEVARKRLPGVLRKLFGWATIKEGAK